MVPPMRTDQRAAVIERRPEMPRGPQWEYRCQAMEIDADLEQYGAEGWELAAIVSIAHDPGMAAFHFKRRKQT